MGYEHRQVKWGSPSERGGTRGTKGAGTRLAVGDVIMANKTLFQSLVARPVPVIDDYNLAGAPVYRFTARHALV